ncbi:hypothetical protein ACIBQ1_51570 [Nonomuraea sp. NPDC050153]|uniref:hypothetical protein n=1 Tax=Nonomuraea sp. NPDC050153 TaxID=3364359 RepID=UPI0037B9801B
MTEIQAIQADIFVAPHATSAQEQPIVAALTALGLSTRVRMLPPRRGPEQLEWLILAALPLQAFLSGLGTKIADDGYRGLQKAVRAVIGGRGSVPDSVPGPPVVLQDPATGLQIVLDADLPEEGYQQLVTLDLTQFELGPVRYDRVQRRWRSDLDEARPR